MNAQPSGPLARRTMAYVLAGGRGSRLMELTDIRAKPAVYFGGKLRIIDFALSNALNSGIRRIASVSCTAPSPGPPDMIITRASPALYNPHAVRTRSASACDGRPSAYVRAPNTTMASAGLR